VSGGEGQRVRLGRAMSRHGVRLVIMDEPFTGLEQPLRQQLLEKAREIWRGATLLCISHDVGETLSFDRVVIIEGGRIVEDGAPSELARRPSSLYSAMLKAEAAFRTRLWSTDNWRRLRIERGRLIEGAPK